MAKKKFSPQECFENYKEAIFKINHDIGFWKYFLNNSIMNYSMSENEISSASFTVYDKSHNHNEGSLVTHEKIYHLRVSDLEEKSNDFFTWIMNHSILNSYSSMEILLLQAIQIKFYPKLENPIHGKRQTDKINCEIITFLRNRSIKFSTRSNDHVIQFLRFKSKEIDEFMELKMNTDLNSRWIDFFNLISILRNIIAHCTMIVQPDIQNEIKSKAKDIFERHFEIRKNLNGFPVLKPYPDKFNDVLNRINTLALNLFKFIFDQQNLSFVGLRQIIY